MSQGQKLCCNESSVVDEQTTASEGETRVRTVASQPSDDMASLQETTAAAIGLHQAAIPRDSVRHVTSNAMAPLAPTSVNSLLLPSAIRRHRSALTTSCSSVISLQVIDPENDCDVNDDEYADGGIIFSNWCYPELELHSNQSNESSCALLISGHDRSSVCFTQACMNDVASMRNLIGVPNGIIPRNNIFLITPAENNSEEKINDVCSVITMKRPKRVIVYFSGHDPPRGTNQPRLYVSDEQGSALDVATLKNFIECLLPWCFELIIILDCCSASDIILLPLLPDNVMPSRRHIQWCSCKAGGKSRIDVDDGKSIFTSYIISALQLSKSCPNLDENCPLCCRFRPVNKDGGINWWHLRDYVHEHMSDMASRNRHLFSYLDLPIFMINPVKRE